MYQDGSDNFPALKELRVYQERQMDKEITAVLSDVCSNRGVDI